MRYQKEWKELSRNLIAVRSNPNLETLPVESRPTSALSALGPLSIVNRVTVLSPEQKLNSPPHPLRRNERLKACSEKMFRDISVHFQITSRPIRTEAGPSQINREVVSLPSVNKTSAGTEQTTSSDIAPAWSSNVSSYNRTNDELVGMIDVRHYSNRGQ